MKSEPLIGISRKVLLTIEKEFRTGDNIRFLKSATFCGKIGDYQDFLRDFVVLKIV